MPRAIGFYYSLQYYGRLALLGVQTLNPESAASRPATTVASNASGLRQTVLA